MGATFPNGIAEFTQKRNLLDDVDANDINRIQDEIKAIEATLGPLINSVTQLISNVDYLSDEQQQDNLREEQENVLFSNLGAQLDYLHKGSNHDAVSLSLDNSTTVPKSSKDAGTVKPSKVLKMAKPAFYQDPNKMYQSGTGGLILRKSGFYIIQAHVVYDIKTSNGNNNDGVLDACIEIGGVWTRGFDRRHAIKDEVWPNCTLDPIAIGWFPKGTGINLRTANYTKTSQVVSAAQISAVLLRQGGQQPSRDPIPGYNA